MPRNFWTEKQIATLLECKAAGMQWSAIAERVGRPEIQCRNKYQSHDMRARAELGQRPHSKTIPNKVALDLQAREEARSRQSVSGRVFGDPPPGFSMLDRRRATA